ncbi:YciI family protein [Trinickia caryophylli]|uniref:Uncharacterized conserved protein YciI, contains a putative active-site phosphohistidine n=1 Tax=Trinickia caryophylli TaxID=28094 RepID=A0A1X7D3C8_TRICW|nr:YciI family protein [Trinickia caryophylli]PMS12778.1 hypothetical protein C0Z17_08150 [Trinickia caryophylli]TRX15192.1 hypothetical protein FNF07_28820 [Trinickia caryophylli]WQE15061.1 YciI family protein [Trinickia caryophylli]SMF07849.1 Uncharacterized conserved protein YciI, contains a putative active-site phosphohistidine [Trinickia caryophylli]GLU31205.1 hypothetical protein Busp01_10470 [Trinickia caryophylli]
MFVVLLQFSDNKDKSAEFMSGHKNWIQQGFSDGVFLLAGSLDDERGGAVLATNTSRAELEARVGADPFVAHGVVRAQIIGITPMRLDARLGALLS